MATETRTDRLKHMQLYIVRYIETEVVIVCNKVKKP